MISADLRFEGFDVRSWTNLVSLFSPATVERMASEPIASDAPETSRDGEPGPEGTLVVVIDTHERLLKAFHTVRGRVTDLEWSGKKALASLASSYGARRVIVLTEGVMDEVAERLALRLQRGDDYVTQWLALARIVREMQDAGLLTFHPRPLANVPVPSAGTVRRALDVVLPDNHSAVFVLFDRQRPWTSFALRRRRGSIDRVVGPDIVSRWVGPLGGDFRRDHRVVVESVSRALAPVHFGLFTEVSDRAPAPRRHEPRPVGPGRRRARHHRPPDAAVRRRRARGRRRPRRRAKHATLLRRPRLVRGVRPAERRDPEPCQRSDEREVAPRVRPARRARRVASTRRSRGLGERGRRRVRTGRAPHAPSGEL